MKIAADLLDFLFVFLPIASLIFLAFRIGLAYGKSRGGLFIFAGGAVVIFSFLFKIYFDFVFGEVDNLWLLIFTLGTAVGLVLAFAGTYRSYVFLKSVRVVPEKGPTAGMKNGAIVAGAVALGYLVFFLLSGRPLLWRAAAVCYVFNQVSLFGVINLFGEFSSVMRKPAGSRATSVTRILSAYYLIEPLVAIVAISSTSSMILRPVVSLSVNVVGAGVSATVAVLMIDFISRHSSVVMRQIKTTYVDTLRVRVMLYLFIIGSGVTVFLFVVLLAAESMYGQLRLSTLESYAKLRLSAEKVAASKVRSTLQDIVLKLQRSEDAADSREALTRVLLGNENIGAVGVANFDMRISYLSRKKGTLPDSSISRLLQTMKPYLVENTIYMLRAQTGTRLDYLMAVKTRGRYLRSPFLFAVIKMDGIISDSFAGLDAYGPNFRLISPDLTILYSAQKQEIGRNIKDVVLARTPILEKRLGPSLDELRRQQFEGFAVLPASPSARVGDYFILTSTPVEFGGYEGVFTSLDPEDNVSKLFQPTNSLLFLAGVMIAGLFLGGFVTVIVAFRWSLRLEKEVQNKVQELRSSEDKYRRIVENPYVGSFILVDRRLIFSNSRLAEILETEVEHLSGSDLSAFVQKDDRSKLQDIFDNIVTGEKSGDKWTVNAITASGRSISLSGYSSVIDIGTKRGVQSLVIDSTAEFREKEKLEQFERLESMATLAAGIAHDFNNILQVVLGSAQLLQHGLENTDLKKYADNITNVALRGSDLSKRLLTFSQHKGLDQRFAFDINAIILESIPLFEETFPRTIKIVTQLSQGPIYVEGDQSQIQQVIFNLAVNARDAMPHGGVLTLKTEVRDVSAIEAEIYQVSPGLYAFAMIKDNGEGIPTDLMSKVFEPFFTTKPPGKGTGLGLSVVYGIVRSHNGFLKVYSEVKKGTVFDIYLPLSISDAALRTRSEAPAVRESEATYGKKILFVDDEAGIREAAQVLLEQEGYKVLTAKDGITAIETFKKEWKEIDLVVLDLNMPELSGREVLENFTIINPDVRVLISTGYITPEEKAGLKGVVEVIEKPFDFDQLVQKVRLALERLTSRDV